MSSFIPYMNSSKVIDRLKAKYPNKKIIALPDTGPTEILCETDPAAEHPEYSVAVAVIDQSAPHHHNESTETYTVLDGELDLFIDDIRHHLNQGESMTIKPGTTHYATGKETWIECRSEPGWTIEDHISSLPEVSKP